MNKTLTLLGGVYAKEDVAHQTERENLKVVVAQENIQSLARLRMESCRRDVETQMISKDPKDPATSKAVGSFSFPTCYYILLKNLF